jgi:hypothetical protein
MDRALLENGKTWPNRGESPLVSVAKPLAGQAAEITEDRTRNVTPLLKCDGRNARKRGGTVFEVRHIAHDKDT